LRLPSDSAVTADEAFADGLVEVQDEGSQLIALTCMPAERTLMVDLCAGAGGKALALAAANPGARIIACDTNRARLGKLPPRAERAGAAIETRLLDQPREAEGLGDLEGTADLVLVDAPCSGSGTWRRNPEGRWRLTAERLERLESLQQRVLDLAAPLVRPGGALVYAVCSLLSREGRGQAESFLSRHSGFVAEDIPVDIGRLDGVGRLLTPGHDRTDGFFIARFRAT
jgi:16S rRNA (cytosine967-C5)-methyltransferase